MSLPGLVLGFVLGLSAGAATAAESPVPSAAEAAAGSPWAALQGATDPQIVALRELVLQALQERSVPVAPSAGAGASNNDLRRLESRIRSLEQELRTLRSQVERLRYR